MDGAPVRGLLRISTIPAFSVNNNATSVYMWLTPCTIHILLCRAVRMTTHDCVYDGRVTRAHVFD